MVQKVSKEVSQKLNQPVGQPIDQPVNQSASQAARRPAENRLQAKNLGVVLQTEAHTAAPFEKAAVSGGRKTESKRRRMGHENPGL